MLADFSRMEIACGTSAEGAEVLTVSADDVNRFCDELLDTLFDGGVQFYGFALGFAAAIDALAAGRVRLDDAKGTVRDAWRDVNDITGARCKVTDVMQVYCLGKEEGYGETLG